MIYFQRSPTRWGKGKAFSVIYFVMRAVLVSTVMSCVIFKGKVKQTKKASETELMLRIFPIPFTVHEFLAFSLESKVSHVMETEAWSRLRGRVIFKYALNQKYKVASSHYALVCLSLSLTEEHKINAYFLCVPNPLHLLSECHISRHILYSLCTRLFLLPDWDLWG